MRVGANARQYAQIKKLHREGTPAHIISKTFRMTPQSLEKILAKLDGREERRVTEAQGSAKVTELEDQNAELRARLAQYEQGAGGQPGAGRAEGGEGEEEEDEGEEEPE